MLSYFVKRFLNALAVLIVVSLLTFFILMRLPGDPAQLILGMDAGPGQLRALRASMGLTKPWYQQYWFWLADLLKGNWGVSHVYGAPIIQLLRQHIPVTFSLAVLAMFISTLTALGIGTAAAIRKNSLLDYFSRTFIQIGMAVPSFWIAMLLIIIFCSRLRWFPISGYTPFTENVFKWLHSIILPAITLAIAETGVLIRIFRSSMLTSLRQDYVLMAKMKGLPPGILYFKYALRNALIAPLTVIGMQTAKLLGGTVIIESVFSLPGIGRLILVAVEQRDLPLLQGLVLFVTIVVVLTNLSVDALYTLVDPRIKLSAGGAVS